MALDRRVAFVRKWYQRGQHEKDPFDRFFSLWIALAVAAQRESVRERDDTDRKKVLAYLELKEQKVLRALEEQKEHMVNLASRRGATYGNAIVDAEWRNLQAHFTKLAEHFTGRGRILSSDLVKAVGELLNTIRNNVFHGVKVYDDAADVALLESLNPVLEAILARCEEL